MSGAVPNVLMPKRKKNLSKREIEETIVWILTHRQSDVRAVLRNFRKLPPNKQVLLDKKLLYLVSILDLALKAGKRGVRCKSCGQPMHVKWFGCPNPIANVTSVKKLASPKVDVKKSGVKKGRKKK